MTAVQKETLSVEDAALILGIGRSLAYDLAKNGKLPGVIRLGRRLVVSRRALERVLREAAIGPRLDGDGRTASG
ncbi:MAG: helix-turn-helix domain-containing protein [Dehalococcoidia bacterium]|jgi:excisionase family DNA binding protein|nr:helix-turn-helix domain-containing protein [Dehalococcoidia bacterium]